MGEMTNEQAARWLKDLLKSDLPMEQYQTAIEKGIEALEPSGDLISRAETLTAFADYVGSGMSMNDYDALWDIVAKMPPVKQEPKTGHWIYDNYNWRCSECNETPKTLGYVGTADFMTEHFKFCNHCGAKMVEPQESEE